MSGSRKRTRSRHYRLEVREIGSPEPSELPSDPGDRDGEPDAGREEKGASGC